MTALRPPAGNRAFWTLVGIAGTIRAAVMLSACCAAGLLIRGIAEHGVSGLWTGSPSRLPATALLTVLIAGAALAGVSAARTARATAALRRALLTFHTQAPAALFHAAHVTGLVGEVTAVADQHPFALTYGLLHPRVVVSTGLVARLSPEELLAVLIHEHAHVRSRDPLKAALARVLTGRYFFLPVLGRLTERYADGQELAADRRAIRACGTGLVASALIKTVDGPDWAAMAPAAAMGSARLLDARIRQLETGTAVLDRIGPRPVLTSLLATAGLTWALSGTATVLAASPLLDRCTG
ncbi:M56 family metallopeptidase [Streptomyces montanisoli]|uniref:M56 family metallopeptidase n=1 Tax=Streptomyces montanisoli TaxID=2798581 RepID=A0A940RTD3_9ACTN|nr:M56 family metallopeptidase [Streptomyces montanisoli]MBP0456081.1 M56 family metallopeptidase [Streptomyces montanisoli]